MSEEASDPSHVCLHRANLTGADLRSYTLTGDDLLGSGELRGATADALLDAVLSGAAIMPDGWTLNKHSIAKHDPKDAR